ncbi:MULTISPECIES: LysE family translocator [unclassified Paracoccus (in: a-proteobacteria)]|uniref:LysE family translocator n=1 Tax=unclassified Paracoccus (in: a-proteobacteria) TaxID=2688777 RepID=UPI0012B2C86F|nr:MULTISPECIES: LysE family translocator [unclassified Paracoccus (in: a-proteobacteria)]UXU75747.1 LysE family translocator [Paracoccus sp. SMMA_5]UXU81654.1 LysE family translocator [Paracoccus sp. SMMA_5_TC]
MIWDTLANFPAEQLLAFMAGALVLNFAPGQDVFFASACGIQGGPRAGALAGLGVGLGVICHVLMATIGLGALVAAHPGALAAIKYAGAGYLLFLAWKSWHAGTIDPRARAAQRPWNIIRRGALSNLLNPKPVLFLLAFLPQFTRPELGPVWQQILGLGLMFTLSGTLVTMGYGVVAGLAGQVIGQRLALVNRLAAVMFAGLALRLVWK